MKLHKYDSQKQYREIQIKANKRKIDWVWVKKKNIETIIDYFLQKTEKSFKVDGWNIPVKVLCHGTRNGKEQGYFEDILYNKHDLFQDVLGTEISPTASQFPNTAQWDFHDQKEEWVGSFDIVYSNALDHSHSPRKCVQTWLEQLNEDGLLFVEWSKDNLKSNEINPFSGTPEEWEEMFPVVDRISGEGTVIFVMK